ncbi:unnamed protein product [Cochlearia groenlandica]
MGDNKRKRDTETEKEETTKKKSSESASFEELRDDLFREAAKLVSGDPSIRIAVFVTPPASEPDGSVHSFGYPSAEGVVQTFLEDKLSLPLPEEEEEEEDDDVDEEEEDVPARKRFWWEDPKLYTKRRILRNWMPRMKDC